MDSPFDEEGIKKLHSHLSESFPDAKLIWKSGRSLEDDPTEADYAEIRINDKMFFSMNRKIERAIFKFGVIEGHETEALKAIRDSGLGYAAPELTNPVACAIVYFLLFIALCVFMEPDVVAIVMVCFGIMMTGIILYLISLNRNLGNGLLKASSVITILGLLPLAPSSMLLFPLLIATNKRSLYRRMDQVQ